jgi:hypothetical protein
LPARNDAGLSRVAFVKERECPGDRLQIEPTAVVVVRTESAFCRFAERSKRLQSNEPPGAWRFSERTGLALFRGEPQPQ